MAAVFLVSVLTAGRHRAFLPAGDRPYGRQQSGPGQDGKIGLGTNFPARYVLAIGCDRRVPTAAGPTRADTLAADMPKGVWQRLSAGPGARGQRYHDWAFITLTPQAGRPRLVIHPHPPPG